MSNTDAAPAAKATKPTVADEEILIDADGADVAPPTEAPVFGPVPASAAQGKKSEARRVAIPPHRMTPLKKDWINIFGPLTEILGLQVRMNLQRKSVDIRVRLFIRCCLKLALIWACNRRLSIQKNLARYKRALTSSRHSLLVSTLMFVVFSRII